MNPLVVFKRLIVVCGIVLCAGLAHCVNAQESASETLPLYFRFDDATLYKGYMDNDSTLARINGLLTDPEVLSRIDSINIYAFASPDGNRRYNESLARRRGRSVKGFLVWKYPNVDQASIHLHPNGENWQGLRALIATDAAMPMRAEVLDIIDSTSDSDRCKTLLKQLGGGAPYRYIMNHMLRYVRNAAVCMVWLKPETLQVPRELMTMSSESKPRIFSEPEPIAPAANLELSNSDEYERRPLFALKTNLLFDAALMPNVEVEVPIGQRWSVNGEWMFPWWTFGGNKYCLQILLGQLEGRYWLGNRQNRDILTGHFFGVYAGAGEYDLQWKKQGYQGEFFIAAGLSYGYAKKISRDLRLEFSLGVGLLKTDYKHYHAMNNYKTLVWQENGKYTWFGPTKLKVSLVWMLHRKVKKTPKFAEGGLR